MTQQKLPITLKTAVNAILQQWRADQNATVESFMNALGTTHRQIGKRPY